MGDSDQGSNYDENGEDSNVEYDDDDGSEYLDNDEEGRNFSDQSYNDNDSDADVTESTPCSATSQKDELIEGDLALVLKDLYTGICTQERSAENKRLRRLCKIAMLDAERIETSLQLQTHREGRQNQEITQMTDQLETSAKRAMLQKNRTMYLERQNEKLQRRCETLQKALDDMTGKAKKKRIKPRVVTSTDRALVRSQKLADEAVRTSIRENPGSSEAVINSLKRKITSLATELDALRETNQKIKKETEKAEKGRKAAEREKSVVQAKLDTSSKNHQLTVEKLRKKTRQLDLQLQEMCKTQVRQQERNRRNKEQLMWARLTKDLAMDVSPDRSIRLPPT